MKRVAFVGTCAIPPMLKLWERSIRTWADEVDEIVVDIENMPDSHKLYVYDMLKQNKKIKVDYAPCPWPMCIEQRIKESDADLLFILHDDTFVLKKDVVAKMFNSAEKKIVTPLHIIYSPMDYVNKRLEELHGIYMDQFNKEYSFLLYFLFMPRKFYDMTSGVLHGVGWEKGEFNPYLMENLKINVAGDTGFQLGLEFFQHKLPFNIIPRQTTAQAQFEEDPLQALKNTSFSEGWVHLQNVANTVGQWFDGSDNILNNKLDNIFKAFLILRLSLIEDALELDDYRFISDWVDYVKKTIKKVKMHYGIKGEEIDSYKKELRRIFYE